MPDQSSFSGPSVPPPNETPLLLTAEAAAGLCAVSLRTWRRLEAQGNVPNKDTRSISEFVGVNVNGCRCV